MAARQRGVQEHARRPTPAATARAARAARAAEEAAGGTIQGPRRVAGAQRAGSSQRAGSTPPAVSTLPAGSTQRTGSARRTASTQRAELTTQPVPYVTAPADPSTRPTTSQPAVEPTQPGSASPSPSPGPDRPDDAGGSGSLWERIRRTSHENRRAVLIGCVAALIVAAGTGVVLSVTSDDTSRSAVLPSASTVRQTGAASPAGSSAPAVGAQPPTRVAPSVVPARTFVTTSETWLGVNVDRSAVLSADDAVGADLRSAGFSRVHALPTSAGPDWRADAFLVATPAVRAATAATGTPAAAEFTSSVPVAVFGTGTDRVEVRKVYPGGLGDLAARRSQDVAQRKTAGAALVSNARVHADPATKAAMQSGGLDLRAGTFLALLADRTDVQVTALQVDPAETAAGLPVRVITISVNQPAAISEVVSGLPGAYQPLRVTPLAGGLDRVQWDIAVAPVPSVN